MARIVRTKKTPRGRRGYGLLLLSRVRFLLQQRGCAGLLFYYLLFLILILIFFILISHLLASMSGYRCRIRHRL